VEMREVDAVDRALVGRKAERDGRLQGNGALHVTCNQRID